MIVIPTDTVVVSIGTKRNCQYHRYDVIVTNSFACSKRFCFENSVNLQNVIEFSTGLKAPVS